MSQDWNAILSSEIAREYLIKEAQKQNKNQEKPLDELQIFANFSKLQEKIKSDSKLFKMFSNWQQQFRNDPEKIKINPKLAQAVLSLNLQEDE